jgi:hypothetical protein
MLNEHRAGMNIDSIEVPDLEDFGLSTVLCYELSITKGQEGHVVGWQTAIGPQGQNTLDTLFVKLDKPAKTIQLEGLPENVVPLTKLSSSVMCVIPSDAAIKINRSQVHVLPNFAMTDYASQGKTRAVNVVDLNSCRSYMAYYTALSRSATSEGTVIVQGFDDRKITCGASGYLRQEFRELELLDEITKLLYENALPAHIDGNLRNALIRQYQLYKGLEHIPPNVPKQLRWTSANPMNLLTVVTDSSWQIVTDNKSQTKKQKLEHNTTISSKRNDSTHNFVVAKGATPVIERNNVCNSAKRKAGEEVTEISPKKKKPRTSVADEQDSPIGLRWDPNDWSCAYDAIFTILCDVWIQNPNKWSRLFGWISMPLQMLAFNYKEVIRGKKTLESARNNIRNMLHNEDKRLFPKGAAGTSISDLAKKLMNGTQILCYAKIKCTMCNTEVPLDPPDNIMYVHSKAKNINDWLILWQEDTSICNRCHLPQRAVNGFLNPPELLLFSLESNNIAISKTVKVTGGNKPSVLPLKDVVYLGDFHFTSRIISNKNIWFHDGQVTKNKCKKEGHISDFDDKKLKQCNNAQAVLAIYAKK